MMSRFEFLNTFTEGYPRFSEKIASKAKELYSTRKVAPNPFDSKSLKVEGTNEYYTVEISNGKSVKCDCPARRKCYHMAIVDQYLKEENENIPA